MQQGRNTRGKLFDNGLLVITLYWSDICLIMKYVKGVLLTIIKDVIEHLFKRRRNVLVLVVLLKLYAIIHVKSLRFICINIQEDIMNKLDRTICEGCASYKIFGMNEKAIPCIVSPIKGNKQCPCLICLIKSMCENSCKEYREYKGLVSSHQV